MSSEKNWNKAVEQAKKGKGRAGGPGYVPQSQRKGRSYTPQSQRGKGPMDTIKDPETRTKTRKQRPRQGFNPKK
jgi:hypothetical protein